MAIISLGFNCDPAQTVVFKGLRKKKNEGYKTCPFDLMLTFYPAICELIKNDFEDFYNPEFLTIKEKSDERKIINIKYPCIFNHESPDHYNILGSGEGWTSEFHFTENNYQRFVERYKNRVDNFRNYINEAISSKTEIIFVISRCNRIPVELDEIIQEKYKDLKYKIAYINKLTYGWEENYLKFLGYKDDNEEILRLRDINENDHNYSVGNCVPFDEFFP